MKKLKSAIVIGCSAMMLFGSVLGVQAKPVDEKIPIQSEAYSGNSEMRALDLITYYRVYNGYLQYRRWDATANKWYDPAWITIGPA